jgi:hypothetical protein
MIGISRKAVFLWMLLGIFFLVSQRQSALGVTIITQMVSPSPPNNYNSYNVFVSIFVYTNQNGDGSDFTGPLLSITSGGESVPFQPIVTNGLLNLYLFSVSPPVDAFSGAFTLTWTNYTAGIVVSYPPIFLVKPQSKSVLVGSNVTFTAQAIHTSGYQWQKDGTNLVEDGHFAGVTNSTLTISNAQPIDSGDYVVIANHPINPTSAPDAYLSVFKPIQLGLTKSPLDGSYHLQAGNQDSSPVDDGEVSHFTIYTTTNLNLSLSDWDVESATGILTNGIYRVTFPDDGSPNRFWQVGQQP